MAERAIRTFRRKLRLCTIRLSDKEYSKGGGWLKFRTTVLDSMNTTTQRGLAGGACTPTQVMSREAAATKKMLDYRRSQLSTDDFLKLKEDSLKVAQRYIGQYVNLVLLPHHQFEKRSTQPGVGREVFKIVGVKPNTGGDFEKLPYLKVEDLSGEPVTGLFRVGEIRIIKRYMRGRRWYSIHTVLSF